jgi:hypothetical protein
MGAIHCCCSRDFDERKDMTPPSDKIELILDDESSEKIIEMAEKKKLKQQREMECRKKIVNWNSFKYGPKLLRTNSNAINTRGRKYSAYSKANDNFASRSSIL